MALYEFAARAVAEITITFDCSGEFSPFNGDPYAIAWTISGTVEAENFTDTRSIPEKICGANPNPPKFYTTFNTFTNNGSTSGVQDIGIVTNRNTIDPLSLVGTLLEKWVPNTNPVISSDGKIDGTVTPKGYYTVELPDDPKKTADDPIELDPPIDYISRVYPGDIILTVPDSVGLGRKWVMQSQERFPKSDRTFAWTVNTSPKIESGGIMDGKLAKPGTIVLPDQDFFIEKPEDMIDGMAYFYENQGVMFNGQIWQKLLLDPTRHDREHDSPEFRNMQVYYSSREQYPWLFEYLHRRKPFVSTTQTVDDTKPLKFRGQAEGQDPIEVDLYFRWGMDFENNRIQGGQMIHDFKDAWSKYFLNNIQWIKDRGNPLTSGITLFTGDPNNPSTPDVQTISTYADFTDGKTTTYEDVLETPDGNLKNKYKITVSAKTSLSK